MNAYQRKKNLKRLKDAVGLLTKFDTRGISPFVAKQVDSAIFNLEVALRKLTP